MTFSPPDNRTSSHYVVVMVDHARRLGLEVDEILSDTGMSSVLAEADEHWIDNALLAALVKRLWRETGSESFGFDPTPLRLGTWALACEYMIGAQTLGDLYRKGEYVLSFLAPGLLEVKVEINADTVSVLPLVYCGERDPSHFLIEFMSVVWHRFPGWAIDENIPLQRAFFAHPKPAHGHLYEEIFHCDVDFSQVRSGFSFSKRYLKKPVMRTRAAMQDWLRDSPADLLYLPGRETSVEAHITRELNASLQRSRRFPPFAAICEQLCMSPQVVRRRLAEEGSSYQQLKDSVRFGLARQLLANPELSISELAERTGFTESAAFSRAFKKWSGVSPASYRKDAVAGRNALPTRTIPARTIPTR